MSGIEAAGIALAVFPILVGGLNQFVTGIETMHRWRHYKVKLEQYATSLESAMAFFLNTLEELLDNIVPSDEEIQSLLREPRGPLWRRREYDERLRKRLDRSYSSYQKTISKLVRDIESMCEKLGVDNAGGVICPS